MYQALISLEQPHVIISADRLTPDIMLGSVGHHVVAKCLLNAISYRKCQVPGWLRAVDRRVELAYLWIYFGFGVCVPLTLLAVGNCGLVVTVRRSSRLRQRYHGVTRSHVDAHDRVTSVLISVVVAYVLLVTPAEILMFVESQIIEDRRLSSTSSHLTALNVTNLLQTVRGGSVINS